MNIAIQQETLNNLWFKNLNFFKNKYPTVFEKVCSLNDAIHIETYIPRFDLLYKNQQFNIYDKKLQSFIYPRGHKYYSKQIKKDFNFKHNFGINTLHEYAYSITQDIEVSQDIEHIKEILTPFTNYINKHTPTQKLKKVFKYFDKFIIFGVHLGYHIKDIYDFYKPKSMLIVEPNLEVFRLSMFIFDYEDFCDNEDSNFYFVIAQNNLESSNTIIPFLSNNFIHNYFIKFHIASPTFNDFFQDFAGVLQFMSPFNFDHSRMLNIVKRTSELIEEKYKFLNLKSISLPFNLPVLILASGPSLKYNIDWLEKNQDKFIIVSVAGSIPRLVKHNIKPDIVVSLDAYDLVKHRFDHVDKETLDNYIIFLSSMSHKSTFDIFNKEQVYVYEVLSNIKLESSIESLTATNVGEMSYALMMIFGVKDIYLLGIDAAFDAQTGSSHDEVTSIGGIVKYDINAKHELNINSSKIDMLDIVETKGNFKDIVKCTRLFYNSVLGCNEIAKLYKKDYQKIYNLSDGAYFNNTTPQKPDELNLSSFNTIDKINLHRTLSSFFNSNSTIELSHQESFYIKEQIKFTDNLLSAIKAFYEVKGIDNYLEFEAMRSKIIEALIESKLKQKTYISKIFLTYFQITEVYINYFFNDKKLKNQTKHIRKLQKIWCNEIIKILKVYKENLNNLY